jgi:DNA-binding CsgD family transcriptional regulator
VNVSTASGPAEQTAAMEKLQDLLNVEQRLITELASVRSEIVDFWVNLRLGPVRAVTPREAEVLLLLRQKKSNKEIGYMLHLSESTVKYHVSNILRKFKIKKRHDLC